MKPQITWKSGKSKKMRDKLYACRTAHRNKESCPMCLDYACDSCPTWWRNYTVSEELFNELHDSDVVMCTAYGRAYLQELDRRKNGQ